MENEMERYIDVWSAMDGIRTVVDAVCGDAVHSLRWNDAAACFELELNRHLSPEAAEALAAQFYLQASYEGDGEHGSLFTLWQQ